MYSQSNVTDARPITQPGLALALCAAAVVSFSFTMPAMRIAVREVDPWLLGPGRGAIAGLVAVLILWQRRDALPTRREWTGLSLVALGVVIGFPLCTSLALQQVPAEHAVIVIGLSPLGTSVASVLRSGERPSRAFWGWAVAGALSVIAFGLVNSRELRLSPADALLLLAVVTVSIGYAEGARLTGRRSGMSVICWSLVLALPITLGIAICALRSGPQHLPSALALGCFAWVTLVSTLLGFAAWYRGLALGGIARGSQVQLIQPVLSLVWCALLLGERISLQSVAAAGAVLLCAAGARLART